MASTSFQGCNGVVARCSFRGVLGRVRRAPLPGSIICMPSIRRLRMLPRTTRVYGGKFNKLPVRVKCYGKSGRGLGTLRCREDSRFSVTRASLVLLLKVRRSVRSNSVCSATGMRTFFIPTKANMRLCTAALRCTPYATRRNKFHYMMILPGKAGRRLPFRATGRKRGELLTTVGG